MGYSIKKRDSAEKVEKMMLNISLDMSSVLVDYALSYSPSQNNLANFKKLLDLIDLEAYKYNYDIYNNLLLCKYILTERLDEGITNPIILKENIKGKDATLIDLCDKIDWNNAKIVGQDAKAITGYIDKKMQFYFFYLEMPKIIEAWDRCCKTGFEMDDNDFSDVNERMSKLVVTMQNSTVAPGLLREFNFSNPSVGDTILSIAKQAQRPSSVLQTGIRQLNAILGPGFRGGKLYVFLGFSGKFKSGTLLNLSDQIRNFNPQLEDLTEDGKRNTLLFITAENTINETIERIYAMYDESGIPFIYANPEDIRQTILTNGKFAINDNERGIDIELRYFNNLEIKTSDIYRIVDEMERNGQRVIGIVVDYIKRIQSITPSYGDETFRVGCVAKELKTLGEYYNVPVITAQQFNRNGNAIIDSAMRDEKSDLLRLVGSSDIGGAWTVVEEADFVCAINLERHKKENRLYLSFKCTKNRCGNIDKNASSYFNHPFANDQEMRLETDLDKEGSLSIMSLASDLESVDLEKLEEMSRPVIVKSTGASSVLSSIGINSAKAV